MRARAGRHALADGRDYHAALDQKEHAPSVAVSSPVIRSLGRLQCMEVPQIAVLVDMALLVPPVLPAPTTEDDARVPIGDGLHDAFVSDKAPAPKRDGGGGQEAGVKGNVACSDTPAGRSMRAGLGPTKSRPSRRITPMGRHAFASNATARLLCMR